MFFLIVIIYNILFRLLQIYLYYIILHYILFYFY